MSDGEQVDRVTMAVARRKPMSSVHLTQSRAMQNRNH